MEMMATMAAHPHLGPILVSLVVAAVVVVAADPVIAAVMLVMLGSEVLPILEPPVEMEVMETLLLPSHPSPQKEEVGMAGNTLLAIEAAAASLKCQGFMEAMVVLVVMRHQQRRMTRQAAMEEMAQVIRLAVAVALEIVTAAGVLVDPVGMAHRVLAMWWSFDKNSLRTNIHGEYIAG